MPARPRGARRSLGDWMIRAGERLSREPAPPCREVSSRAWTRGALRRGGARDPDL